MDRSLLFSHERKGHNYKRLVNGVDGEHDDSGNMKVQKGLQSCCQYNYVLVQSTSTRSEIVQIPATDSFKPITKRHCSHTEHFIALAQTKKDINQYSRTGIVLCGPVSVRCETGTTSHARAGPSPEEGGCAGTWRARRRCCRAVAWSCPRWRAASTPASGSARRSSWKTKRKGRLK